MGNLSSLGKRGIVFIGNNLQSALSGLFEGVLLWSKTQIYSMVLTLVIPLMWLVGFKALAKVAQAGFVFLAMALLFTYITAIIRRIPSIMLLGTMSTRGFVGKSIHFSLAWPRFCFASTAW